MRAESSIINGTYMYYTDHKKAISKRDIEPRSLREKTQPMSRRATTSLPTQ